MDHPDLSVTAMPRADSDRRDPEPGSHLRGNVRHDTFQNDGEDARRFEGQAGFDERFGLRFAASLFLVSALFSDVLWQHAEMTTKGNARANNGFDLGNLIQPALEFHRFGSGFDQSAGAGEGLRGGIVGMDRQVRDHHRPRDAAAHDRCVIDHLIERHRGGILTSGDHHPE